MSVLDYAVLVIGTVLAVWSGLRAKRRSKP